MVIDAVEESRLLVCGGSVETELRIMIHEPAAKAGGRVQLAIDPDTTSFDVIPVSLAENLGFNPVDNLVDLKNALQREEA